MLDPKEPVPLHYGIYTSMTPGKTGGYGVEDGFQSPEGGDTNSIAAFGA